MDHVVKTSNTADIVSQVTGQKSKRLGPDVLSEYDSFQTFLAAYAGLPTQADLSQLISDATAAEARGYYDPIEDDRLRDIFTRYLGIRVALWDVVRSMGPKAKRFQANPATSSQEDIEGFALAFCAAELIVRTGEYLIRLAKDRDIVWRKLDEAELRYALPRKSFTRLYRQLTSPRRMHGFYKASMIYETHEAKILDKVLNSNISPVADILTGLNLPKAKSEDHHKRYGRFIGHSLKRRHLSATRNVVFSLFEMMGSDIADLKIPLAKPPSSKKRVTPDVIADVRSRLQPGDVFVTRHDDAMSNLFLPGFWPHSALWLGAEDADILEAKKDGVRMRSIHETLQVDSFIVLRPKLNPSEIATALANARSHAGKLYDFIFDFNTSDRLVCTEVIYRTYHGVGPIDFQLSVKAGRNCLSAEDLLNQGLGSHWFELILTYGIGGNDMAMGAGAKMKLRESFEAQF